MVSPEIVMLSVFITPWMKPTFIHCAISAPGAAPRRAAAPGGIRRAGQRRVVARDGVVGQRRSLSNSPRAAKYWKVPTRRWLAATRVSTAPGSGRSR
jgi:hypothetical protein